MRHHGNRDFYMDIKTIDDVNKLNDKILALENLFHGVYPTLVKNHYEAA